MMTCEDKGDVAVMWQLRILWRLRCVLIGLCDCPKITWDYRGLGKADSGLVYKHLYSHYY